uniref:Putative secreted protein n=1 Tax=Amblyomma cajennense TaxID=34607 RepID=A0A023FQD8_AMBCJ
MFLTFVAAACVFFTMGLDVSSSDKTTPSCGVPKKVYTTGKTTITIPGHADNCSCVLKNGTLGQYPDNTTCFLNGNERQRGKCTKGVCTEITSTYGCAGKNGTEQGSKVDRVLCTFECTNENGQTEWAYSPDGTPCLNEDDPQNTKNGTCKHRPRRDRVNETVCFPNDQMHLLGC